MNAGWQPLETAPCNVAVLAFVPNWEHYGPGIYRAIRVDMGTGKRWTSDAWACGRDFGADAAACPAMLTQSEWAHFVIALKQDVGKAVHKMHFYGGSEFDAPWQNVCIVAEISEHQTPSLRAILRGLRQAYRQDSIAMIEGDTELL